MPKVKVFKFTADCYNNAGTQLTSYIDNPEDIENEVNWFIRQETQKICSMDITVVKSLGGTSVADTATYLYYTILYEEKVEGND